MLRKRYLPGDTRKGEIFTEFAEDRSGQKIKLELSIRTAADLDHIWITYILRKRS